MPIENGQTRWIFQLAIEYGFEQKYSRKAFAYVTF